MSQQIAPDPVAAAATLAATSLSSPDLSNRREIPITSFDFLQGSYLAAKKAKTIALGALLVVLAGLAWSVASTLLARMETERVAAEAAQLRLREDEAIASLGASLGSDVDVRLVLERDVALSAALSQIASSQVDLTKVLSDLGAVPTQGVVISQIAIGDRLVGDAADLPSGPRPKVLLIGSSGDLRTLVSWADTMRSAGALESFEYERSPGSIQVVGYTTVDTAAPATVQKITGLGVNLTSTGVSQFNTDRSSERKEEGD